jgi:hypothetical protein
MVKMFSVPIIGNPGFIIDVDCVSKSLTIVYNSEPLYSNTNGELVIKGCSTLVVQVMLPSTVASVNETCRLGKVLVYTFPSGCICRTL